MKERLGNVIVTVRVYGYGCLLGMFDDYEDVVVTLDADDIEDAEFTSVSFALDTVSQRGNIVIDDAEVIDITDEYGNELSEDWYD